MLASGKLSWYSELRPLARQMGDVEGVSERKKMTLDDAADRSLYCNRKKKSICWKGGSKKSAQSSSFSTGLGRAMEKAYCNYRPWPQIKLAPFSLFLSSLYNILCLTIAYTIIYIYISSLRQTRSILFMAFLLWSRRLFR